MAGLSALGTKFVLGSSSTAAGSVIANLTGISGPSISVDTIDVTAHDSTNSFREFVAGIIDAGEVSLEGNFVSATAGNIVLTELTARTSTKATIVFPSGAYWYSTGSLVTGLETDAPFDGKIGFSATVKLIGKPTLSS